MKAGQTAGPLAADRGSPARRLPLAVSHLGLKRPLAQLLFDQHEARADRRSLLIGCWLAFAIAVCGINTLNVTTLLHDNPPGLGGPPVWRAVLEEASSAISAILMYPAIWVAARHALERRGNPLRAAPWLIGGLAAFAIGHIVGFVLIRQAVFAIIGQHHSWPPPSEAPYELWKDTIAFTITLVLLEAVLIAEQSWRRATEERHGHLGKNEEFFSIRDGARTWRVSPSDVVAVRGASNYAEFIFADGRRVLARTTLESIAAGLARRRFVRVHRSWVVNSSRIVSVKRIASGGLELTLDGGLVIPASRTYRRVLKTIDWIG